MTRRLPHRWASWLASALAVVLLAVVFVALNWSAVSVSHVEGGDFAANSLLVQEAERLSLLTGHYSRFGFFHPGPALLYLLAGGEWLLYDVLHVVPSGLSGQLVAVAVYDAVWIVLLARLVRQWSSDWRLPVIGTGAFLVVVTLFDHQFINGLWFPLMYLLPFAVLVASLGALAAGWARAVLPAALATGVLVNGHASFVVLVPILVVGVLVANLALTRRERHRRLLSRAWPRAHARLLVAASTILAVLLLPLLVRTVQEPPGPLADYLRFGDGGARPPLSDAVDFAAQFWGGRAPLALSLLTMALLLVPAAVPSACTRAAQGLAVACLSGTLTVLVYAVVGVDSTANTYLGYFAYALPGLLGLAVVTRIWARVGTSVPAWATVAVAVAAAVLLLPLHLTDAVPPDYDRPEVLGTWAALEEPAGNGPVVLDLDSTGDWGTVWSSVAALRLLDVRAGERRLCIDQNWSILFTADARCTAQELAGDDHYLVVATPAPGTGEPGIALVPTPAR